MKPAIVAIMILSSLVFVKHSEASVSTQTHIHSHDLFRIFGQLFPSTAINDNTCVGLTDNTRAFLGESNPESKRSEISSYTPLFISWYSICLNTYVSNTMKVLRNELGTFPELTPVAINGLKRKYPAISVTALKMLFLVAQEKFRLMVNPQKPPLTSSMELTEDLFNTIAREEIHILIGPGVLSQSHEANLLERIKVRVKKQTKGQLGDLSEMIQALIPSIMLSPEFLEY